MVAINRSKPLLFSAKMHKNKEDDLIIVFFVFQVDETSFKSFLMSSQVAFKYSTKNIVQKVDL